MAQNIFAKDEGIEGAPNKLKKKKKPKKSPFRKQEEVVPEPTPE